jgi:hypothetical protein
MSQVAANSVEQVKSTIRSIEHNDQHTQSMGPAINKPAAVRSGEDCFKKKKSHGG